MNIHTLKNKHGLSASFITYGQRLTSLRVPDKNGDFTNIVLGYQNPEEYIRNEPNYFGALIGRYGNRIGGGQFSIEGKVYKLDINQGENHLHGGINGFHSKTWDIKHLKENKIEFFGVSSHMEDGYPGNLNITVTYTLTDENELIIQYRAFTDIITHVNLTNHSFFNLKGAGIGTIENHVVKINSESYIPVDDAMIPKGNIASVAGTPFDFRKPKRTGKNIDDKNEQLVFGQGYDHCYVLKKEKKNLSKPQFAAKVIEPSSGRTLEVHTDEPGIQFYTGNFLSADKNGNSFIKRGALCLETQHFPDSPNNPNFPSTLLSPNELYTSTCIYKFGLAHI
ncbi:aldose epimerase family protein [Flagellimonas maritima]|uniref:aldose epimerase family protein n=1 Tax=Flagellimonas maritima TaxID=1383885 RepID=UPI001981E705|nr:aldose epimerase family protein [Allomuricauda aurantiaca]